MATTAIWKSGMESQEAKLRDGTAVQIRPVRPEDKELLMGVISELSDRSRYHRFATVVRELSEEQIKYLTEIDYDNHVAWVAIDSSGYGERAVGVARYIRLDRSPSVAEVAITVVDSHQRRGLGTLLLARLAQSAKRDGVERFIAYVLWDNAPVIKLIREVGASIRVLGMGMVRVSASVSDVHEGILQSSW